MSIMDRYNPLDLDFKVILVSNASSPLGVVVSNTLLKANAFVCGFDEIEKHESLAASTFSHFQFWQCKLSEASAAEDIIAHAKHKFKKETIDGLVILGSADDDAELQAVRKKLANACAKDMTGLHGGTIINTLVEGAVEGSADPKAVDALVKSTKDMASEVSSKSVRCNMIAHGDKENSQPCQQFEDTKDHFQFLFKNLENQPSKNSEAASAERQAMFDFSNVVLFLASNTSEGLDGVVLNRQGQVVQS